MSATHEPLVFVRLSGDERLVGVVDIPVGVGAEKHAQLVDDLLVGAEEVRPTVGVHGLGTELLDVEAERDVLAGQRVRVLVAYVHILHVDLNIVDDRILQLFGVSLLLVY